MPWFEWPDQSSRALYLQVGLTLLIVKLRTGLVVLPVVCSEGSFVGPSASLGFNFVFLENAC